MAYSIVSKEDCSRSEDPSLEEESSFSRNATSLSGILCLLTGMLYVQRILHILSEYVLVKRTLYIFRRNTSSFAGSWRRVLAHINKIYFFKEIPHIRTFYVLVNWGTLHWLKHIAYCGGILNISVQDNMFPFMKAGFGKTYIHISYRWAYIYILYYYILLLY